MARREPRLYAAALALGLAAIGSCTVFNGKTLQESPDDSGVGDTGALDAAGDSAAPLDAADAEDGAVPISACCKAAGAVVSCEDFETGFGTRWVASSKGPAQPPKIDDLHTHCGSGALHLQVPGVPPSTTVGAILAEAISLSNPKLSTGFYTRAWLYMTSASVIPSGNTMTFFQVQQNTGLLYGVAAQIGPSDVRIVDFTGTGGPANAISKAPLPREAWSCVTWHLNYDPRSGSSELSVNDGGTTTASLTGANTQPTPPYAYFILQAYFQTEPATQTPIDLWIDDVVFDSKPLFCSK